MEQMANVRLIPACVLSVPGESSRGSTCPAEWIQFLLGPAKICMRRPNLIFVLLLFSCGTITKRGRAFAGPARLAGRDSAPATCHAPTSEPRNGCCRQYSCRPEAERWRRRVVSSWRRRSPSCGGGSGLFKFLRKPTPSGGGRLA